MALTVNGHIWIPCYRKFCWRIATAYAIPFTLSDYVALAGWSGRAVRDHKYGYINSGQSPNTLTVEN
ncbi:MAG: hypothetical protein Tsb002_15290 [Wenzhouxiangellaceae bacterium]